MPYLRNTSDRDIHKTCRTQNTSRFFVITKPEKWRPRGNRHVEIAIFLDGSKNDAESNRLVGRIPNSKCHTAPTAQYAVGFIERLLGPGKMQHSEVQD